MANMANQSLLPVVVHILLKFDLGLAATLPSASDGEYNVDKSWGGGSSTLLAIAAVSAATVLNTPYITPQAIALGLCSVLFLAFALVTLSNALASPGDDKYNAIGGLVSANGSFSRRCAMANTDTYTVTLRDFSMAAVLVIVVGAYGIRDWGVGQQYLNPLQGLAMILVGVIEHLMIVAVVSLAAFLSLVMSHES